MRYDPGSGNVVASVSLDGTVQIKSCYNPNVDGEHADATGPFAHIRHSGETVFKFNPGQWINSFSFSPSGEQFVWATHDSELHFCSIDAAQIEAKKTKAVKVTTGGQPVLKGMFVREDVYVGCGFDKAPLVFKRDGAAYKRTGTLDAGLNKARKEVVSSSEFKNKVTTFEGEASKLGSETRCKAMDTKHTHYINC